MTERNDDDTLETLFAAAKTDSVPDEAFLAKLMADADRGAAQHVSPPTKVRTPMPSSIWSRWLPVSGLTAATLAGFWIGMVLPTSEISMTYFSDGDVEIGAFVPSFGVDGFLEDEG